MLDRYTEISIKYADDVLSGTIPACMEVKAACKRFLDDLDDCDLPFVYNQERAARVCIFIENLVHIKGEWSGTKLKLEPWQIFILANLFGWEDESGCRRFRRAFIFVPRKNGKTALAAGIALAMLTIEADEGAEIYCGATNEAQALMVFDPVKWIIEALPELRAAFQIKTMKKSIYTGSGRSFMKLLVGKPGDGSSPHCAIHDEYHEHKTSAQVDAMSTGMGSRREPLQLIITTAGFDVTSPCKEMDDWTRDIVTGKVKNEQVFAIHYTIDKDDDWQDIEVWKKANPNFGVSVNAAYLEAELLNAQQVLAKRNIHKTKHLNLWVSGGNAWMDVTKWNSLKTQKTIDELRHIPCFIGMDLASKVDITSLVYLFKDGANYHAISKHYLPSETVASGINERYKSWAMTGDLIVTEGGMTDFRVVENDLREASKILKIQALAFDPREASNLIQNIEVWANFDCIEIPQGPAHISEPMKELEGVIYDGKITHNGDPILDWMIGNVVQKNAASGVTKYYYPARPNAKAKIDGVVALIMALSRAMLYNGGSYLDEGGGILVL